MPKQEYSFVRVRPEFGVFCTDIGDTRVMITGRDVFTTSDPEVVEALSAQPELQKYIEAEVEVVEKTEETPKSPSTKK